MQTNQRGFTLVETLFYTVGLVVLFGIMAAFLYYMYDWYQKITVGPRIDRIGNNLVDKMIKDIRSGTLTNAAQNGSFSLTAHVDSAEVTKTFSLVDGRITYRENSGAVTYLTPSDVTVSNFAAVATSTAVSHGIKFYIDIEYYSRYGTSTQTYSGFSILRQSY